MDMADKELAGKPFEKAKKEGKRESTRVGGGCCCCGEEEEEGE
jgi:hypothetical protein